MKVMVNKDGKKNNGNHLCDVLEQRVKADVIVRGSPEECEIRVEQHDLSRNCGRSDNVESQYLDALGDNRTN